MSFTKITGDFLCSDEKRKIAYYIYEPKSKIKGIIQISHGMCEYIERYEGFAEYITRHGWLVCGNDHLGHGKSVESDDDLGYFSEERGWVHCVNDLYTLNTLVQQKYKNLPHILFGHSMGSFIARAYITRYGKSIDGAIICGTSAGFPHSLGAQLSIFDIAKKKDGERHRSAKIDNIMFGKYNHRIPDKKSSFDWLSTDEEVVEKYEKDKLCNFLFTINGVENLVKALGYVSDSKWYTSISKDLPIFIVAGKDDPVGNYGDGVYKVFTRLSSKGCNVRIKLYSGMRHEILNEIRKEEPYADILCFAQAVREGIV